MANHFKFLISHSALCSVKRLHNYTHSFLPIPGVKVVAESLALSSAEETQEYARNLLHQLSTVSNYVTFIIE